MRKQLLYVLLALILPVFFACNNREKINSLQKETETIHDDAMKDMAGMNRLSRSFKKELAQLDSLDATAPRRDSLLEVLAAMDQAEEDMMAWMAQYKAPDDLPADAALLYLQEQKQLIEKNLQDIRAALDMGKSRSAH